MSRFSKSAALVVALALLVSALAFAGDAKWIDMDNCEMCKPMAQQKGLMENMTWEQYDLSNGIVSITTVKPDYMDEYKAAKLEMDKSVARMQQGEQLNLCGSCMSLGMIMMKGVKSEEVPTSNGELWLLTSDDPELVSALQEWAAKNKAEMKKHKAPKG